VIIVPWSILASRYLELVERAPKLLIVDEAHFAKNDETLRSQALQFLTKRVPHLLLLTGTPLINNEHELEVLKNLFGEEPPMIRRLLENVAKDIPAKTRSLLPVKLRKKDQREYDRAEEEFDDWLEEELRKRLSEGEAAATAHRAMAAEALVKVGYLRRLVGRAKVNAAADWIGRAVLTGEAVVVFLEHQEPLKRLRRLLRKQRIGHVVVEGSTPQKARQDAVDSFQRGDFPVFIGTKAAKEGITLHRARHLLFLERYYTSADEEQAEDRIRRIGQKHPTTIWFLHAVGTLDDRLSQIIDTKRRMIDNAIGSADIKEEETETVIDLISSWGKHVRKKTDVLDLGLGDVLPRLPSPAVVCSLMFGSKRWSPKAAGIWAKMNGYHSVNPRFSGNIVRVGNHSPSLFEKGSFVAVALSDDVYAVLGTRRSKKRSTRSSPKRGPIRRKR
jgi:ERCC4-related helicase